MLTPRSITADEGFDKGRKQWGLGGGQLGKLLSSSEPRQLCLVGVHSQSGASYPGRLQRTNLCNSLERLSTWNISVDSSALGYRFITV